MLGSREQFPIFEAAAALLDMRRKNEAKLALGHMPAPAERGADAPPNAGGEEEGSLPSWNRKRAPTDALGPTVCKKVRSQRAAKGKGDKAVFEMNDIECAAFLGDFFNPTRRKKLMGKDTSALLDGLSAKLIRGFLLFSEVQDPLRGFNEVLDDRNKAINDVRAELKSKDEELISTLHKLSVAEEAAKTKDTTFVELKVKIASLESQLARVQKNRDVEMDKLKVRCETARQEKETALKEQQRRFEAENAISSANLAKLKVKLSSFESHLVRVLKNRDLERDELKVRCEAARQEKETALKEQQLRFEAENAISNGNVDELKVKIKSLESQLASVQKNQEVEMDELKVRCETARQEKETALKEQQIKFEAEKAQSNVAELKVKITSLESQLASVQRNGDLDMDELKLRCERAHKEIDLKHEQHRFEVAKAKFNAKLAEREVKIISLESQLMKRDLDMDELKARCRCEKAPQEKERALELQQLRFEVELEVKLSSLESQLASVQKIRDLERDELKVHYETARQENETALKEQQLRLEAAKVESIANIKTEYFRKGVSKFRAEFLQQPMGQQFLHTLHTDLLAAYRKTPNHVLDAGPGINYLMDKASRLTMAQIEATDEQKGRYDPEAWLERIDKRQAEAKFGISPEAKVTDEWWIPAMDKAARILVESHDKSPGLPTTTLYDLPYLRTLTPARVEELERSNFAGFVASGGESA